MGCKQSKHELPHLASSCREIAELAEDMLAREIIREQARIKFTRARAKLKIIKHLTD